MNEKTPRPADDVLTPGRRANGHGDAVGAPIDALLGDDPDLWLALADMRTWSDAHACDCEALCECGDAQ